MCLLFKLGLYCCVGPECTRVHPLQDPGKTAQSRRRQEGHLLPTLPGTPPCANSSWCLQLLGKPQGLWFCGLQGLSRQWPWGSEAPTWSLPAARHAGSGGEDGRPRHCSPLNK